MSAADASESVVEGSIHSEDVVDRGARFLEMSEEEQKQHLTKLWRRAFMKGKAGGRVIRLFGDISQKISLFGISRHIEDKAKKRHKFVRFRSI